MDVQRKSETRRRREEKSSTVRRDALSLPSSIRVSVARSKTMETGKTIERQARVEAFHCPTRTRSHTHVKPTVLKFNRAAASRMPLSSTS